MQKQAKLNVGRAWLLGLLVVAAVGLSLPLDPVSAHGGEGDLVADETTAAITLDGVADEAAWNDATAYLFEVANGDQPGPDGDVSVRALYDDEHLYMLFEWNDASGTESSWVSGWVYDDSGDDTDNYDNGSFSHIANANPSIYDEAEEDRLAVAWNINTEGVDSAGWNAVCHGFAGTEEESKDAKSGMYTNIDGQTYDEWHWKAGRSNALGIAHDKWVGYQDADGTAAADWDVEGGHHTDGAGIYGHNRNANKTGPKYFEPGATGEDANFLFQSEIDNREAILVKGNEDQITNGTQIPGRILKDTIAADDTWDVKAKGKFDNGKWTLELKRELTTASPTKDVQFTDFDATYTFGVAVFDDGGHYPQHAHSGAISFAFEEEEVPVGDDEDTPGFTLWVAVGAIAFAAIGLRRRRH